MKCASRFVTILCIHCQINRLVVAFSPLLQQQQTLQPNREEIRDMTSTGLTTIATTSVIAAESNAARFHLQSDPESISKLSSHIETKNHKENLQLNIKDIVNQARHGQRHYGNQGNHLTCILGPKKASICDKSPPNISLSTEEVDNLSVASPSTPPVQSDSNGSSATRLLLLCNSFNSMTQRIYLECKSLGYEAIVHVFESEKSTIAFVNDTKPAIILCPFLTKRVPEEVYANPNVPCLIFHPGIIGDRGLSAIDWALLEDTSEWGLTVMQAEKEMDSGDIWTSQNFSTRRRSRRPPTKSTLYRHECIEAAVKGVREVLRKFNAKIPPTPLDYSNHSVKGTKRPTMKDADRKVDWELGMHEIVRIIRASDSQPGVLETFGDKKYSMFGAHEEEDYQYDPSIPVKTIIGQRHGAVLISCGLGEAVWITHLKKLDTKSQKYFKLPATMALPDEMLQDIPVLKEPDIFVPFGKYPATFQEIFAWSKDNVCYVWFDFYNGAMSTDQCKRLCESWDKIMAADTSQVIVLMGGSDFFSNGINLNTIEAAADPKVESLDNINTIDDFVKRILMCKDRYVISAMQGNGGAGGVMAAIAADEVWTHGNVVLNPSYKGMNLYGSEYWTYSLPRRVGSAVAGELTGSTEPLLASDAAKIGLVDRVLCPSADNFLDRVYEEVENITTTVDLDSILDAKRANLTPALVNEMQDCRDRELKAMRKSFEDPVYHERRKAFVYKTRPACHHVCVTSTADDLKP